MHNVFWALIILFLVAAFLRMDWVYYLVYVVGGVWIFSHFWIRRSLGRIHVERSLPGHAFTGEVITAHVRLTNRSWLPVLWLQIQEAVPLDLKDQPDYRTVVSVGSRSAYDYIYQLACKRRGYYNLGPLQLRTSDLFGFVEARWEELAPAKLIVYPEVVSLQRLGLPSRSPFGALRSAQRLMEDPARMAGVRTYATGDSLRRVHWKASAHENTLLVKKLDPSLALPVTVVLDLNRNAYPPRAAIGSSEWAIVIAASVANYLTGQRQPVGLVTNGMDPLADVVAAALPQRTGQEHLMTILSLLARVQMHDFAPSLAEWLPRQIASMPWGATLVVVTPLLDEQLLWTLHDAFRRGTQVVTLVCAHQVGLRALQARGSRLGIHIHSTIWESDLETLDHG